MNFFSIVSVATLIFIGICRVLFVIVCSMILECIAQLEVDRNLFLKLYLFKQILAETLGINWVKGLRHAYNGRLLSIDIRMACADFKPKDF
ncbi:MAG TPA: hypothetical protein VKR53_13915, partial [Puia sp.]|nr:hypothetical protein [Puia sp.]